MIIIIFWCFLIAGILPPTVASAESPDEEISNFKKFSRKILQHSEFSSLFYAKGAGLVFPFGVGYTLANVQTEAWDISTEGFNTVLGHISSKYGHLVKILNEESLATESVVYVTNETYLANPSIPLLNTLKTHVVPLEFNNDWNSSWAVMNNLVSTNTDGTLENKLVPKGSLDGTAFYPFTVAGMIITNNFKSNWLVTWIPIGHMEFNDGSNTKIEGNNATLPFYQLEDKFPVLETECCTAVAIKLDGSKHMVFVLPKNHTEDMKDLFDKSDPGTWQISSTPKKVQVPELNLTLIDQHDMNYLEKLGINKNVFCPPPLRTDFTNETRGNVRTDNFLMPIAQACHFYLGQEYIQLSSATGVTINSMTKLEQFEAYRSPISYQTLKNNDTQSSRMSERHVHTDDDHPSQMYTKDSASHKSNENLEDLENCPDEESNTLIYLLPENSSLLQSIDYDTILFNRPFMWYLHDSILGSLYYGGVISLSAYAVGKDDFEDSNDIIKSMMWNC